MGGRGLICKATILFALLLAACVPKTVSIELTGVNVTNRSPYGQSGSPNEIAEEDEEVKTQPSR